MRKPLFLRPVIATGVAVIALASAVVFPVAAANAAVLDGIDNVVIVSPNADPSAPLEVNQQFAVNATWSVPDTAQPGDTFGLTFPSPIGSFDQTFNLLSPAPESAVVGTCMATATSMQCTLGDYVLTHDNVHGNLSFQAVAVQETTEDELTFTTDNGVTITTPIPGGGIVDVDTDGPTAIDKYGFMSQDGESIGWTITVPAAQLPTLGAGVVLTDTYDSRLDFDASSVTVGYVADDAWDDWADNNNAQWLPAPSPEWVLVDSPATSSFDLTFPTPEADGWYVVTYYTDLPDDVENGDVFGNTITANGTVIVDTTEPYVGAGGGGDGDRRRAISVTKAVDGAGTAPDVDFAMAVACVDGAGTPVTDYPQTKSIAAGETAEFGNIPVGSVCTVNETDNGGANAVTYSPSNTVTVTTTSPSVIEFTVTNTFNIPPVPAIDIEKWSTEDGFPAGDFDTAPGKSLDVNTPEAITFTITNTGTEPLINVVVGDTTQAGPVLTDISCDFSELGGPATGTTWAGPFAVGATFDCTAMLPGMASNTQHSDTATVNAVGQTSGIPVGGDDPWHGHTPPVPGIDIEKEDTNGNDADTVGDAVVLPNGTADLVFTITNTGAEPLVDVTVSDTVVSNGVIDGLSCVFPDDSVGVTWAGPFAVGDSFECTAKLSGVVPGTPHEDVAKVTGTGQISGLPVDDKDPYFGVTPKPPVSTPAGSSEGLALTGASPMPAAWAALLTLLLGAGVTVVVAKRRKARIE